MLESLERWFDSAAMLLAPNTIAWSGSVRCTARQYGQYLTTWNFRGCPVDAPVQRRPLMLPGAGTALHQPDARGRRQLLAFHDP